MAIAKQASRMEGKGLTAAIAGFAAGAANCAVPDEAIAAARRAFIDTIGVMLAGRQEEPVRLFAGLLGDGYEALALPGERMLMARDAAMLNGFAGHILDYDDVAQAGHPSVVLVPAILAEAQRIGASGREALAAYAVGFEAWAEVAGREPDAFHHGSWHPTAVIGVVAATAALCALHRLDADVARDALALSASMASGVIANFGTPMKPLQAGRAASHAIEAVALARAGLGGAPDALESAHGLLRGISPRGRVDTVRPAELPANPWRLVGEGLSVKRYPVCHASHRAIDAVIGLASGADLATGDVAGITVTMGSAPAQTLRYRDPENALQARFSMQHNAAAALVDRAVGFAQLTDAYVTRTDIAGLYPLTRVILDDGEPCPEQPGLAKHDRVVIETRGGARLDSGPVRYPRGHANLPLSDEELAAKFIDCARHGGHRDPERLLSRLERLDEEDSLKGFAL